MSNLNELDPDSPEYEAAAMAAQQAEDEARGITDEPPPEDESNDPPKDEPAGEPKVEAEAKPADAAPAAEAAPPAEPAAAKPGGVMSKDGKTVLPYRALQGARQQAAQERVARQAAETRAAALEQEIADLKAGKKPEPSDELTLEAEAEMLADFPGLKPVVAQLKATRAEVERLRAAAPAPAKEDAAPANEGDELQDAIDGNPLLAEWQNDKAHADKWQRAIVLDKALEGSPKWANKPMTERFAHVARLVADEFDIAVDTPPQTEEPSKPTKTVKAPAEVIKEAPRAAPSTLSDFKGGAADPGAPAIHRMPPIKQMGVWAGKTDAEIDEALRKLG